MAPSFQVSEPPGIPGRFTYELGSFTFYNLRSTGTDAGQFKSSTTSGESYELGNFTFYDFRTAGTREGAEALPYIGTEVTTTGTSQELGSFTYFNFLSSDGSSTSGTTQTLGNTDYWSLTETEPVEVDSDPFSSIFDDD